MIKTGEVVINEKKFEHTYSDDGHWLIQDGTGTIYAEAVDPPGSGRTYTEGELNPDWVNPFPPKKEINARLYIRNNNKQNEQTLAERH